MKLKILSNSGGKLSKYLPNVVQDIQELIDYFDWDSFVSLDVETNMVDSILDRKLITIAFSQQNKHFIVFFDELEKDDKAIVLSLIRQGKFIIQNSKFEYKVFRKFNIRLNKFYDTYLTQKLLNMGLDGERADLSSITEKWLGIRLPKELQTSFISCDTITDEQVDYMLNDVIYLERIKELQEDSIQAHDKQLKWRTSKNRGLKKANWWNHEFIKVLSDWEYEGVRLDKEKWLKLYDEALIKLKEAEEGLNIIVKEDFSQELIANNMMLEKDTFSDKLMSSAAIKLKWLQFEYPDIKKTSIAELKKYLFKQIKDNVKDFNIKPTSKFFQDYIEKTIHEKGKYYLLKLAILRDELGIKKYLYYNHRKSLLEAGILIEKGKVLINWKSSKQRLTIFQWIDENIESTQLDKLEEYANKHRLIAYYIEHYQHYVGLVTKFGLNYIEKIEADGLIRTTINPIVNTGRISSSNPNMLNLTNDERYRACFIAGEGRKCVMSDFKSEELTLVAHFAKQQNWIDFIRADKDLHSLNAQLMYKDKWEFATEPDCLFKKEQQKCSCKEHKKLRQSAKTVGFGSLYGLSKFGLAFRLKVTEDEAQETLEKFFAGVPQITNFMKRVQKFAIDNLYNPEFVLGACRFVKRQKVHYDANSVKRTSFNFSIQGAGASILKIATVLIRRHSLQNNKPIQWITIPYDEIVISVPEEDAEYWKEKLKYFMELAGRLGLRDNILKADEPVIEDYWVH